MKRKTFPPIFIFVFLIPVLVKMQLFDNISQKHYSKRSEVVSFFDSSFVVIYHDRDNDKLFFQYFDENGENGNELLLGISEQDEEFSFSVSKGISNGGFHHFYIFIRLKATKFQIFRIVKGSNSDVFSSSLIYSEEFLAISLTKQIGLEVSNSDNQFDYLIIVYETKDTNSGEVNLHSQFITVEDGNYIGLRNIKTSFSENSYSSSSFPSISVTGSKVMIAYIVTENAKKKTQAEIFDINISLESSEKMIPSSEFNFQFLEITSIVLKAKDDLFTCICSIKDFYKTNRLYGFAYNTTNQEVSEFLESESQDERKYGNNADIEIFKQGKELILIVFYQPMDSSAILDLFALTKNFDGKYLININMNLKFDLDTSVKGYYEPEISILPNKNFVYSWTEVNQNYYYLVQAKIVDDLGSLGLCPIGSYIFEGNCTLCGEGSSSNYVDSTNCECDKGYYIKSDENSCVQCPENTYKDTVGNNECYDCPENTFYEGKGAVVASMCGNLETEMDFTFIIIGIVVTFGVFVLLFIVMIFIFSLIIAKFRKRANRFEKRANRFDHIEGVEMILKEAELDQQDSKIPKIRISKSKYIVDFKEIKIIKKIGQGASASMIYLCDWNGTECAFKGFSEGSSLVGSDEITFNEFEKEVEICVGLNHPSILRFYGASITPKRIGLLIQYCVNGDLCSFLKNYSQKNNEKYQKKEKLRILKEIVAGMDYLHNRKIIHRDLKPENVLLDENEKVKIMDFGLSKTIDNAEEKTMTKMIGTVFYMAPEVIKEDKYSFPCDVYSWSIMSHVIISENYFPYGKKISQPVIMRKMLIDPNFRPEINKQDYKGIEFLIPILKQCWNFSPEKRHTFTKLKELTKGNNFHDRSLNSD